MNKYLKEVVLWVIIVIPYIYLYTVWNSLPESVPTHFDLAGNPNDWSSKTSLIFIVGGLSIGMYILMVVIPFLDPKKKIQQMGTNFYNLRFMLTLFFSILATYLIYIGKEGSIKNPKFLFGFLGLLFAALGNYFQTVRPNYFIGIRTPWTLESEHTWKKTHRLGGRMWMAGGVLIALLAFIIPDKSIFMTAFFIIIIIMSLVPVVYSYFEFQKEKRN
jgi:uncharacterized membrane protein